MRWGRAIQSVAVAGATLMAGAANADAPIDFARQIRPILSKNCFACHGPDTEHREAGLRLDEGAAATARREAGAAIVPGKPEESLLIQRVSASDVDERMPPAKVGPPLSAEEVSLLRQWIAQGGVYAPHWSFVRPARPKPPAVHNPVWARNPIDRFLLARMDAAGLAPNPEADRYTLARRVSLDLRGLPPTLAEVDAFVADERPNAYERLVDRFLADPAFGERWARPWLDLARYADSAGYGSDPLRTIWRYRDWVIDAFNHNLPFDEFTRRQIAGDLMANATEDHLLATAFHRNTMTNTEGGTDDEEFRIAAVKDRVDTTLQAWMGLTVGCAKCHNHKFDPISQREYYQLFAFFDQTEDNDQPDESPTIASPPPLVKRRIEEVDRQLAALRKTLQTPTPELARDQAAWEASLASSRSWTPLKIVSATREAEQRIDVSSGGTKVAADVGVERLVLVGVVPLSRLTGARVEIAGQGGAAARLPAGSRIKLDVVTLGDSVSRVGRRIRIELAGKGRILSLAEVEVFSGSLNVARGGGAKQSSTSYGGDPGRAIDGNTDGVYDANSTTHTAQQDDPWWDLDLGKDQAIDRVVVWNRSDGGVGERLAGATISLFDASNKVVWSQKMSERPERRSEWTVKGDNTLGESTFAVDLSAPVASFKSPIGWIAAARLRATVEPAPPRGAEIVLSLTDDEAMTRRGAVDPSILAIVDVPSAKRTEAQKKRLSDHYLGIAPALDPVRKQIKEIEAARPAIPTVPVMKERPLARRRATRLLVKGNFLEKGEAVTAAVPAALHPLESPVGQDRLKLADWLVAPANPMTARTQVNRFWSQIQGAGLVATEEDFGAQGDPPTHPELLDWLAVEFASDWDVKRLLRLLVTSAAYRQSALTTPDKLAKDPRNLLYSRANRPRLEAEMIRDQALALAGMLDRAMRGPSVYPPQPDGLWQPAFNGQRTWPTSEGGDRYRRGLYTFWRRTVPYPSMATFDAPSREICALRRPRTNTPLQAFVTLNDPAYLDAARGLATRIMREGGEAEADRLRLALRLCAGRPPEEREVAALKSLLASERTQFRAKPELAQKLISNTTLPAGASQDEFAAWIVVANILLNLDAVLTRG